MKNIFILGLFVATGLLCACNSDNSSDKATMEQLETEINSNEFNRDLDPKVEMRKRDNLKLGKYLRVENNRFVLDITEEEALELGVSKESYQLACEDIIRENSNIEQAEKEGKKVNLPDTQKNYEKAKAAGVID